MAGANEVQLPVDRFYQALEKFEELEMWGTVELDVPLLPQKNSEVSLPRTREFFFRNSVHEAGKWRKAARLAPGLRSNRGLFERPIRELAMRKRYQRIRRST